MPAKVSQAATAPLNRGLQLLFQHRVTRLFQIDYWQITGEAHRRRCATINVTTDESRAGSRIDPDPRPTSPLKVDPHVFFRLPVPVSPNWLNLRVTELRLSFTKTSWRIPDGKSAPRALHRSSCSQSIVNMETEFNSAINENLRLGLLVSTLQSSESILKDFWIPLHLEKSWSRLVSIALPTSCPRRRF